MGPYSFASIIFKNYPRFINKINNRRQTSRTSVYQLFTDNWKFAEYNLAGVMIKSTDMSGLFKHRMLLARDDRRPRFLLTPIGEHYLDEMVIVEITNEH